MRAPAEKRSTDEIVAEIMKLVGYPNASWDASLVRSLPVYVRKLIDDLRAENPPFAGNQRNNKDYLNDLRRGIADFKRLLRRAPKPLKPAVFAPERFESLYPVHGTALGISLQTREYLEREPARLGVLISELDRICTRCDELARRGLGSRVKFQQRHAAIASRTILEDVASQTGTKLSLSCKDTSKYCKVASLFFEAATGEYGKNLVRACEAVAGDPYASGPFPH